MSIGGAGSNDPALMTSAAHQKNVLARLFMMVSDI